MTKPTRKDKTQPAAEEADDGPALSLDALSAAFAEAVGEPQPASGSVAAAVGPLTLTPASALEFVEPVVQADSLTSAAGDEQCSIGPLTILEALLFVGDPAGGPIAAERLAGAMRGVEPAEIHELVCDLNGRYEQEGRPYIVQSEGAGYRLTLREEHHRVRDRFQGRVKQARLSQAAVDVLALVAYNQPLAAEDVQRLRGSPSGAVLGQLVRRQLLSVERPDPATRVLHYRTTRRFLDVFGLASLDDLPTSRDLDEK